MRFSVRRARPADAGAVADVHLAATRAAMPYLPELHTERETRDWVRDVVLDRDEVHVADAEGRVVGFVALAGSLLDHLNVEPDVQGRGIGSALLELAKELRPDGFDLWVFQRNAKARAFYERRGLRLVELTDGAGNDEREPDARYAWRP
ncbi:MAG TPA: GNAT family N-acetyltransferase [Gaiellaceae bacterium]|jgi:GNAT superfamily N-acetyltransferase